MKKNTNKISLNYSRVWKTTGYIIVSVFVSFTLFSILWMVLTSLKTNNELFQNVWSLPEVPQFSNYVKAWNVLKLASFYRNSLIVVSSSVVLVLVVSLPCAYALTKIKFRFREALSNFIILGMGIPVQLIIIPLFLLLSRMNLTNNLIGLIIAYIVGSISFTVFMLYGFLKSLPTELEEAAMVDGSTPFKIFMKIILPISTPGLITVSIFNFVFLWNEYLLAMVLIRDSSLKTVSYGLYSLQISMQYTGDWVSLYAGLLIAIIPIMVIFFVLSELIVESITLGAVKG